MNSPEDPNQELQRREREIRERENALRLREIEAEIKAIQPSVYQTSKHQPQERTLQTWQKKIVMAAKFFALVVIAIASVKVAGVLAGVIIVGLLAFVAYKLFFDDQPNR